MQPAKPRADATLDRAPPETTTEPEPEPKAPLKSARIDSRDADIAPSKMRAEPSPTEAPDDVLELTQETEGADDILELTQETAITGDVLELTQEAAAPRGEDAMPQGAPAAYDDDEDAEPLLLDQPAPTRKSRRLAERLAAVAIEPDSDAKTKPPTKKSADRKPKRSWLRWPRKPKRK